MTKGPFRLAVLRVLPLALVLIIWELGLGSVFDEFYVSKPSRILTRLYTVLSDGSILGDLKVTLAEILLGYLAGSILGLVFAYFLARHDPLFQVFEPYLVTLQATPKSAIAPLFILWLGIGIWSKVAIGASMVFFLVFYNTLLGLRLLNEELINLARIMGASERDVTRRVVLPSVFPHVLTGLKTALPYCIIGVTVGEFIAAPAGIGAYILRSTSQFDPAGTFAGVILLLSLVLVGNTTVSRIEARLMRWRPKREEVVAPSRAGDG